jgi:hypothetical protein
MTKGLFIRSYSTTSGLTANFGQVQSGGLPNITGTFSGHENHASGAFSASGSKEWHGNRNDNGHKRKITFNASKSNSLYGAANEVRPINRCYLPIIKY